jgi:hypothetical protein
MHTYLFQSPATLREDLEKVIYQTLANSAGSASS